MRKIKYMLMCGMLLGCSSMTYPAMAASVSSAENIVCEERDNLQHESVNPLDYEENTRERFVASMASEYNISYEMADKMEKEQSKSIARTADEVLKYRTIDKSAGSVTGVNGYKVTPHIATEVQYVYNKATKTVVSLVSMGKPLFYVPGITINESFDKGEFNINKTGTKTGRVSLTAAFTYNIPSKTVTVGGDIVSVSAAVGGYKVTTKAKTYVITIAESNLK